jgi:hypothetical protein
MQSAAAIFSAAETRNELSIFGVSMADISLESRRILFSVAAVRPSMPGRAK